MPNGRGAQSSTFGTFWTRSRSRSRSTGDGTRTTEDGRLKTASASARELTRGPGAPPRRHRPDFTSEGRRRRDGAPGPRGSFGGEKKERGGSGRKTSPEKVSTAKKKVRGRGRERVTTECRKVLPFSKNNLTVFREPIERPRLSETTVCLERATLRARVRSLAGATSCHDGAHGRSSAHPQRPENPVV